MPFNTRKQSHKLTFPMGFPATRWPLLGAAGGRSPYTGLVATRGQHPTYSAGNTLMMTRSGHRARGALTTFQVIWAGWYQSETPASGTNTLTASIEYPAGTFTQVKFSGATSAVVPNGGMLTSDPITVAIPDNALFWVRSFWSGTSMIIYANNQQTAQNGDLCHFGTSGVTDMTMGGTIPNDLDVGYYPLAIIGTTTKASVVFWGDSITEGYTDTMISTDYGDRGYARSVSETCGYVNLGHPGDTAGNFLAAHTNRVALAAYASHVVCSYGFNDLMNNGVTPATLSGQSSTFCGYAAGKTYLTTILPRSTSTDGWATTGANQTTDAANGNRTSYNDLVRAGISGAIGYFDLADTVESARNSGLWKGGLTGDGTHPTRAGDVYIAGSGVFPAAVFV